jgi:hypothetical protein
VFFGELSDDWELDSVEIQRGGLQVALDYLGIPRIPLEP